MQQIVYELHTGLVNAGIRAPFLLVGHSLGGLIVRVYATRYPKEVAGMVLVDSSHEDTVHIDLRITQPLFGEIFGYTGTFRTVRTPRRAAS